MLSRFSLAVFLIHWLTCNSRVQSFGYELSFTDCSRLFLAVWSTLPLLVFGRRFAAVARLGI